MRNTFLQFVLLINLLEVLYSFSRIGLGERGQCRGSKGTQKNATKKHTHTAQNLS
jgi:hypothetical protein